MTIDTHSEQKKIESFRDLYVWKAGHRLVVLTYKLTKDFPKEEIFALVTQMRRAAVSITSNIAEGFSRRSLKDKVHFYRMAAGSLTELHNQFLIAKDVGYLEVGKFIEAEVLIMETHRILNGLISKTESFQRPFPKNAESKI